MEETPLSEDSKMCGGVGGPAVNLVSSIQWIAITAINTMAQTFEAEVDISLTVRNGVNIVDKSFEGPGIKITNGVNLDVIHDTTRNGGETRHDDLVYQFHCRGVFSQKFQLENFPIDNQELQIHFQSQFAVLVPGPGVTTKRCCRFVLSDTDDPIPCTLVKQGATIAPLLYNLQHIKAQVGHTPKLESKRRNVYSRICTSVAVQRRGGYHFWNVLFPSFLFTSMEFLSLLVDREDLADRLSVTITLLLTLAAYKIVSADALPDIPYLTLLDTYLVACVILSAMLALQNGIASKVPKVGRYNFDQVSGAVVGGLWVLFNIYIMVRWRIARASRLGARQFKFELEDGVPYMPHDRKLNPIEEYFTSIEDETKEKEA